MIHPNAGQRIGEMPAVVCEKLSPVVIGARMQHGIARDHITAHCPGWNPGAAAQRHKQGGIFGAIAFLVKQGIERPAVGGIVSGGLDMFPDPVKELAGRSFGVLIFNRWCQPVKGFVIELQQGSGGQPIGGSGVCRSAAAPNDRVASSITSRTAYGGMLLNTNFNRWLPRASIWTSCG